MSNLHALLIAVDFYFPHMLPGNIYYPSLGGCVRDVTHVETYLRVTNTQSPGAANDPARILNISVLDLSSDWSITQIFPTNTAFHPLDPGQTLDLPFEASLPAGQEQMQDTIKVFATQESTDFRWLELPSLDQEVRRSATRAAITDPLEQLLAQVTDPQATTRTITFAGASRQKRWALSQVELHVRVE